MNNRPILNVTICMGSSCFSRGNNRNIEVVQRFIGDPTLDVQVDAKGHLCEGLCKSGPNIIIDGKLYSEVDPVAVLGLMNHHMATKRQATEPTPTEVT